MPSFVLWAYLPYRQNIEKLKKQMIFSSWIFGMKLLKTSQENSRNGSNMDRKRRIFFENGWVVFFHSDLIKLQYGAGPSLNQINGDHIRWDQATWWLKFEVFSRPSYDFFIRLIVPSNVLIVKSSDLYLLFHSHTETKSLCRSPIKMTRNFRWFHSYCLH